MKGLVLEGGAARGAFHIGAYQALMEEGYQFQGISGTSIGSINGAFFVADQFKEVRQLWESVDYTQVFNVDYDISKEFTMEELFDISKIAVRNLLQGGIDTEPMIKIIDKNLSEGRFRRSDMEFAMVTINMTKMKKEIYYKNQIPIGRLAQYLMASSDMPIFKKRKLDGCYFLDGCFYDNLPFQPLKDKGFKDLVLIRCNGRGVIKPFQNDPDIKLVITPSEDLGPMLRFHHDYTRKTIKLGYLDARRALGKTVGNTFYLTKEKDTLEITQEITREIKELQDKKIIEKSHDLITIMEKIGSELGIPRVEEYTQKQFLELIKSPQNQGKTSKTLSEIKKCNRLITIFN